MRLPEPGRLAAATHALVIVHLVLAGAAVLTAAWCFVTFGRSGPDDDPLIGFLVVYGVAALLYAAVTGTLGLLWLRTRWYAFPLALGLVSGVFAVIPAIVMLGAEPWWVLAGLVALALPAATGVLGFLGVVSGPVSPTRSAAGWPG